MRNTYTLLTIAGCFLTAQAATVERSFAIEFEAFENDPVGYDIKNGEYTMHKLVVEASKQYVTNTQPTSEYASAYSLGGILLNGSEYLTGSLSFELDLSSIPDEALLEKVIVTCGCYPSENEENTSHFELSLKNATSSYAYEPVYELPKVTKTSELVTRELNYVEGEAAYYNHLRLKDYDIIKLNGYQNNSRPYIQKLEFFYTIEIEDAKVGFEVEEFEAPLYGFEATTSPMATVTPEGLPLTYSTSDENVATINANTGELSIVAEGEAMVTASFDGNGQYGAASASYVLKVVDSRKTPELSFGETECSVSLFSDYQLPQLANPLNLPVTFSSTEQEVAKVDENGEVTICAEGETTISASFAGNSDYLPAEASYKLIVTKYEIEDPEVLLNGTPITSSTVSYSGPVTIVIKHPGTVYHKFYSTSDEERDMIEDLFKSSEILDGFEEHDQDKGFTINEPGTFSYYTVHHDTPSDVKQIEFRMGTVGLELIEAEATTPLYFNLSGQQITDPADGVIVIVKQGNHTFKMVK